ELHLEIDRLALAHAGDNAGLVLDRRLGVGSNHIDTGARRDFAENGQARHALRNSGAQCFEHDAGSDVEFADIPRRYVGAPDGGPVRVEIQSEPLSPGVVEGGVVGLNDLPGGIEPLDVGAVRDQHTLVGKYAQRERKTTTKVGKIRKLGVPHHVV